MDLKKVLYIVVLAFSIAFTGLSILRSRSIQVEKNLIEEALSQASKAVDNMRITLSEYEVKRLHFDTLLEQERSRAVLSEAQYREAERERERLTKEIALLKTKLKETEALLFDARVSLGALKENQKELSEKLANLRLANRAIESENKKLKKQLSATATIKSFFSEFAEEARMARKEQLETEDRIALSHGNQGYLVKNGAATNKTKVEVKVLPADL